MLTLGKIGGTGGGQWRQASYYSDQVALGAEDYYSGQGEAPGTWVGSGADALRLDGQVLDGELETLLGRQHPRTGAHLGRPPGERSVLGIDVQMAVPKSVSTVWALADEYGAEHVAARIWDATHGAANAALGYLERQACRSRAGAGGHIALKGEGFVAAVFPHRFSREGDPQIHVHMLVANMTACGDAAQGVQHGWRTLDARDLYRHQRAAGYLFQAELRDRLTDALGVEWTEIKKGAAEIVGVPPKLVESLSQRRSQILDALARDGRAGTPAETQIAALTTRRAKESFDLAEQRARWVALAQEHGFGPDELADTLGHAVRHRVDEQHVAQRLQELLGPDGLTKEESTFTRRDVVEQLAAGHRQGASIDRIEQLADDLLASTQVVALTHRPDSPGRQRQEALYTTADMLAIEARMVDRSVGRADEGAAVVELPDRQRIARRPSGLVLSDEQQAMVEQLVTSGAGVEIVRAKAGTGKTTAIDAARTLWDLAGYRVIGTALSGRAADELRARGGMDSYTLHGLLTQLDRGDEWALVRDMVVVVDEASMVDTRRLARLLDHAADAGAKVVLIGDERQLPAIDAGGAFAALADRLGAVELEEVHRQRQAWDRAALDQLRHGDLRAWTAAYERHGRLVPCPSADQQLRTLVEHWYVAAREHGIKNTLMLAARRAEVDDLNQLARAARAVADELDDSAALVAAGRSYVTGDRVLALRNRYAERADRTGDHQLRNGNLGTVTHVDLEAGDLSVTLDSGTTVRLPADYMRDGHLTHGYATTIHKAQGMTTSRTFVLASPDLARELGYVASSRHTDEARFYVNAGRPEREGPAPIEEQPFYAQLERALGHERAKHLALDQAEIDSDLRQLSTERLLEISDRGQRVLTSIPAQARRAQDTERLERAAAGTIEAERRLTDARAEVANLGRFRRSERDELGRRIEQLDTALDSRRHGLTEHAAAIDVDTWIDQHEIAIVEATAAEHELAARRADAHWRATQTAAFDPDPAIERHLGPRPEEPAARERWERVAAAHESYRLQYGNPPASHNPTELVGRQADDWREANRLQRTLIDALNPGIELDRAR